MCGPSQARSPLARQKVFFRRAPHASTGRAKAGATLMARGTYPRERRTRSGSPATIVATESSRARDDVAIVEQEQVGDASQPTNRFGIVEGNRLVRQVARGHHQRPPVSASSR